MTHSACMHKTCGFKKQERMWSMSDFSKALSRHLRNTDPAFRELSDKISARLRRNAK